MPQVTVHNRIEWVENGTCLSDVLSSSSHPCGGKGICGKCKVRVQGAVSPLSDAEKRHLTAFELADGIRLACCTIIQGDCAVTLLDRTDPRVCVEGEAAPAVVRPGFAQYGVAVDIGTTTLAARLYAPDGAKLAECGAPNPQGVFGADVISRIEAALQGKGEVITEAIRTGLCRLLTDLTALAGLLPSEIEELVITGNTVMLTLLTDGDVRPFATAPFVGCSTFGKSMSAASVGLDICPEATVYLTPCASAFIGGDVATALLAADLPHNGLLIDIGTNGEMVLKVGDTLYACSTAAGPAFEGVGISCGQVASIGAIDRVELVNGTLHAHVIGGGKATGLCGSGLVDAVACLALMGDADGPVLVAPDVTLTKEDIQALLVSKSAIRSGMDTLLQVAGLAPESLTALTIAGGFGRYLNIPHALRLGLLPAVAPDRVQVVGNAALAGATQLLLDVELREKLAQQTATIQVVDLARDPYFAQHFIENMTLEVP